MILPVPVYAKLYVFLEVEAESNFTPIKALFVNKEDIKILTEHLTNETTKYYGEKYF